MKHGTIIFNNSLFISLSQFVAIPEKAFQVIFYEEKLSEILHSHFYERFTPIQKNQISVAESLTHLRPSYQLGFLLPIFCLNASTKIWSARVTSHHPVLIRNFPI